METLFRISPNKEFFSKIRLSLFYHYSPLTSCKKSEKSKEPFLRKLHYQPTNQPTHQPVITNNTDFIGLAWRRFKKKYISVSQKLGNKLLQGNTYRTLMSSLLKKISLNSSDKMQKIFVIFLNFQHPVSGEKPNTPHLNKQTITAVNMLSKVCMYILKIEHSDYS